MAKMMFPETEEPAIEGGLRRLRAAGGGLSDQTVVVVTFALAGFANFSSIAIQIGAIGGLAPERRGEVAQFGLKALLAGSLVNFANAAIAGVVAS